MTVCRIIDSFCLDSIQSDLNLISKKVIFESVLLRYEMKKKTFLKMIKEKIRRKTWNRQNL